jgi:N-acyl-D-amino-acid deacylase
MTPTRSRFSAGKRVGISLAIWVSGLLPTNAATDIVVRGARVLDGTGAPWFYADVLIRDGLIHAVGRVAAVNADTTEIDGRGCYLAPGFIDPHSHAGEALETEALAGAKALIAQGVTTVFINPDGGGALDLLAQRDAIMAQRPAVNVAALIGHNTVREAVMGYADRDPTADELQAMRELVRAGMAAGAYGLSAGPFYAPGSFSRTPEQVALAAVAAEWGGVYSSHIRDEGDYSIGLLAAVDEVIAVAREARLPGIVTHIKALGPRVWGLSTEVVSRIEAARADGVEVFADQYPYEASSTSLAAALLPRWAQEGDRATRAQRLHDDALLPRLREEIAANLERRGGAGRIQIRTYAADPTFEGQRLDVIAQGRGERDSVDTSLHLLRNGGAAIVSFNMHQADLETFMAQPWVMTSSDGALVAPGLGVPHPRSYGSFPRKLRRFAMDDDVLSLEQAVHSMTGLTATVMRLRDRGLIRPGMVADLVLFDPERVTDRATYTEPHQFSEGMRAVVVAGTIAWQNEQPTGLRAGAWLRLN